MNRFNHRAYLVLGSNIAPRENIPLAMGHLRAQGWIRNVSIPWETHAVGSRGPNFLNLAVEYLTPLPVDELKFGVLRPIEARLGRIRTAEKDAPRPIDLDIIVFDGEIVDPKLWERPFLILPLAELLPELAHPESGQTLATIARELAGKVWALPHPDFDFGSESIPDDPLPRVGSDEGKPNAA